MLRSKLACALVVTVLVFILVADQEANATPTPVACGDDFGMSLFPHKHHKPKKHHKDVDDDDDDDKKQDKPHDNKDINEKKKKIKDLLEKLFDDLTPTSSNERPRARKPRIQKTKGPLDDLFSGYVQFINYLFTI